MTDAAGERESPSREEPGSADVLPPIVYVPRAPGPAQEHLEIDLRVLPDGKLALPVYSALDRLIAHCGPAQPWVALLTENLEQIDRARPFDVVLLDVPIPQEFWRKREDG